MKGNDTASAEPVEMADVRARILAATAGLVAAGGVDAATTRAVAAAAGVQAPTIYRLFGDKRGLLDAVAEHGLAVYVADKTMREPHPDPVQALRDGWDLHVEFGLAHPGLYAIMSGGAPSRGTSAALAAGREVLRRKVRNVALAGRLRTSEERAVALVESACNGTVLTLLGGPEERRDPGLSAAAREAVLAALTDGVTASAEPGAANAAAALRASLDGTAALSEGERALLEEWLDRIANEGPGSRDTSGRAGPGGDASGARLKGRPRAAFPARRAP